MAWGFHGGGVIGDGGSLNAAGFAVDQHVVVVTFNYHLGFFGRFTHRALRKHSASPEDRSGN